MHRMHDLFAPSLRMLLLALLMLASGLLMSTPVPAQPAPSAAVTQPTEKVYYQISYIRVAHGQDHGMCAGSKLRFCPSTRNW
jgi:hypothetical protein